MLKKTIKIILFLLITSLNLKGETESLQISTLDLKPTTSTDRSHKKGWNFMVYIASNNNLYNDSITNIIQMMKVGSNKNINILIQHDTYGKNEIARYYIEKEKAHLMQVESDNPSSASGTPQNLYNFAKWAIKNYPAKRHALILWNHGSGIEDPHIWGKSYAQYLNEMFSINQETGLIELSRKSENDRGIAFNDVFKTYITNQELRNTLSQIKSKLLNNKKIDILGMDACHMAMLEVGTQIKEFAKYMVGSEEVEPGSGWDYKLVLKPFIKNNLTPKAFAQNIVEAYKKQYEFAYADHTQSASDLENFATIESILNNISKFLITSIKNDKSKEVINAIKRARTNKQLTVFENRDYIDHRHFYEVLLYEIKKIDEAIYKKLEINKLENLLNRGIRKLNKTIIANTSGSNLQKAGGLSFYFPRKKIHSSYPKTIFAQKTNKSWLDFIKLYIKKS